MRQNESVPFVSKSTQKRVNSIARTMLRYARQNPSTWQNRAWVAFGNVEIGLFAYAETLCRAVLAGKLSEAELSRR